MSVVLMLQKNVISGNKTLNELLREALLIATKLNLNDFKEWINKELKGYDDDDIPKYRVLRTSLKFFNPYRGWMPAIMDNKEIYEIVNTNKSKQSISELEYLCSQIQDNNDFILSITDHHKKILMQKFKTDFEPTIFVPKVQLIGILDKVKTLLLEWTLKLEQEGILGDENMTFTNDEKEKAMQTVHIENFYGVMGEVGSLGNLSTGNNAINTSNIEIANKKIENLINEIKKSSIADKEQIIAEIESTRHDKVKLTSVLGGLLSRASEISSIVQLIKDIM